jgi:hypothetical protein
MLHLLLATTPDRFATTVRELAAEGTWTWAAAAPTADPGVCRVELSVGEAPCALSAQDLRDALARFVIVS